MLHHAATDTRPFLKGCYHQTRARLHLRLAWSPASTHSPAAIRRWKSIYTLLINGFGHWDNFTGLRRHFEKNVLQKFIQLMSAVGFCLRSKWAEWGYTRKETYILHIRVHPDVKLRASTSIRRFGHYIGSMESSNLGTLESDALTSCWDEYKGRDQTWGLIEMLQATI
jgi:hypothetical protein